MKKHLFEVALTATMCVFMAPSMGGATTLAPVSVTASAVEDQDLSPGSVTVIRPDSYSGEMRTLPDLLSRVAGVSISSGGGRGARAVASVRGSTSAQVAVYVDGVLWNLGGDSAADLSTIPIERVDRIEVYRGYVPATFDLSGMGAVINVVTVSQEAGEGAIALGIGDLGYSSSSLRYGTKLGSGTFSIALEAKSEKGDFPYRNDNGSITPLDDYDTRRWNNGFWEEGGTIRWSDGSWRMAATMNKRHRDLPLPAPGNDKGADIQGPWQDVERRAFSLGKSYSTGEVDWGWSIDRTEEDKDFSDPLDCLGSLGVRRSSYRTVRDEGALFGSAMAGDHFLELTLKGGRETLDVDGDTVSSLGGIGRFERDSFSAVLQDTVPVGDVIVTPLLRWNKVDGESALSWALGAQWNWTPNWMVKATVGYSKRAPNFYETYGDGATIIATHGLRWEEGTHWDLGVRWEGRIADADATLGLTAFGMDMDDLIEYVQINQRVGAYRNIGQAMIRGLELEGDFRWERWTLGLSWTFMDGENRTPGYRYGRALPNRPENSLDLRLTRLLSPSMSIFGEIQHRGTTFLDMAEQIGLSDLTQFNLGLRWAIKEDHLVSLGVDDLFDKGYEVTQFATGVGGERLPWYPQEGRTWYLSYSWRF